MKVKVFDHKKIRKIKKRAVLTTFFLSLALALFVLVIAMVNAGGFYPGILIATGFIFVISIIYLFILIDDLKWQGIIDNGHKAEGFVTNLIYPKDKKAKCNYMEISFFNKIKFDADKVLLPIKRFYKVREDIRCDVYYIKNKCLVTNFSNLEEIV